MSVQREKSIRAAETAALVHDLRRLGLEPAAEFVTRQQSKIERLQREICHLNGDVEILRLQYLALERDRSAQLSDEEGMGGDAVLDRNVP